jgi:hypothetical protein
VAFFLSFLIIVHFFFRLREPPLDFSFVAFHLLFPLLLGVWDPESSAGVACANCCTDVRALWSGRAAKGQSHLRREGGQQCCAHCDC